MRSAFGPLLFGLGLLLVTGCVLPDHNLSFKNDSRGRLKDRRVANDDVDAAQSDTLAFKSPKRQSTAAKSGADNLNSDSVRIKESSTNEKPANPDAIIQTGGVASGYSFDQNERAAPNLQPSPFAKGQRQKPNLNQASHSAGNERNPIQLSGLEAIDGPLVGPNPSLGRNQLNSPAQLSASTEYAANATDRDPTIKKWADRPEIQAAAQKAQATSASPFATAAVEQTTHSDTAINAQKPFNKNQLPPLPWQSNLDQLIAEIERTLAQSKPDPELDRQSEYTRRQAYLRLLYMMSQRQEQALTAIPGIAPNQQEFWQQMIWAMSNELDAVQFPDSGERATQAVSPLNSALKQLREEAHLSIKNMTFCRKISYFGNYERFPKSEFTPGQEVLLYTEIENFVSVPTNEGEYRTSLKSTIEIADGKGAVVWQRSFPATEDFCRNPRRDYFHSCKFHIPEDIATGTYSLKLTIADELSQKRVSSALNFVVK